MKKTIKAADVAALRDSGVDIVREKREVAVDGLQSLVEQFERIARANEAIAAKRNTDLLEAINKLTLAVSSKKIDTVDLRPVLAQLVALQEMQLTPQDHPVYTFDIKRNSRGLSTQIIAQPVSRAEH